MSSAEDFLRSSIGNAESEPSIKSRISFLNESLRDLIPFSEDDEEEIKLLEDFKGTCEQLCVRNPVIPPCLSAFSALLRLPSRPEKADKLNLLKLVSQLLIITLNRDIQDDTLQDAKQMPIMEILCLKRMAKNLFYDSRLTIELG